MVLRMLNSFLVLVVMSLRQFSSKNADKCNLTNIPMARTKSNRNRCFQIPHMYSVGFFRALHPIGTELEEQDMERKAIILTNMITKILLY